MKTTANLPDHYPALDGLRVFSAFGIVLMHVGAEGKYALNGFVFDRIIPSFFDLVFLFMMLSGFSICCGYFRKVAENQFSLESFYRKRFAKSWPFFAVLCILNLIIQPNLESVYEVFANLTLCFGFMNTEMNIVGVGWFLGIVFIFYMTFPFFCFLMANRRRAWFSFAIMFAFNLICRNYFGYNRKHFLFCMVFFMAGFLLYHYRDILKAWSNQYRLLILVLCAAAAAVYYVLGTSMPMLLIVFSLLIVYSLGDSHRILSNSVTHFLSDITFEIYLSQFFIYRALELFGLCQLPGNPVLGYIFTSALTILGTIVFSFVGQKALVFLGKRLPKFSL